MIALLRTEFTKAARRTRTLILALLLVGLPTLIVAAINARGERAGRDRGEGLFRLAHQKWTAGAGRGVERDERLLVGRDRRHPRR